MNIVLLSGGSGKRLWPLSNSSRSKQFIKALRDEKTNERVSMLQRNWRILNELDLTDSCIIAGNVTQEENILSQLRPLPEIVLEPETRDTFPAILLSCTYLHSIRNISPSDSVVVLPVDCYTDESFFRTLKLLPHVLQYTSANLVLMGAKPTSPSDKFGYILPSHHMEDRFSSVSAFIEKPSIQEANELIERGAYWNCGVFVFRLQYILEALKERGFPTDYHTLAQSYHKLPKISFDYEIVEKEPLCTMVEYDGMWKDLGTWDALTDEMAETIVGKGQMSEDCINTHIVNELDIPIVIMGITDAIIAASPDGILVSKKNISSNLKHLVPNSQRMPMYEEKIYGWTRIIDSFFSTTGIQSLTKHVHIELGKSISYHLHVERDEIWTLLNGEVEIILDDVLWKANAGEVIQIHAGVRHAIRAINNVDLIETQVGESIIDSDIVRFAFDWNNNLAKPLSEV